MGRILCDVKSTAYPDAKAISMIVWQISRLREAITKKDYSTLELINKYPTYWNSVKTYNLLFLFMVFEVKVLKAAFY